MIETPLTSNERRFLSILLLMIVFFVGADLFNDSQEGVKGSHLLLELFIAVGAAAGIVVLMKNSFHKNRQLTLSQELVLERGKEVEMWKRESQKYIQGLSSAIDSQLARWSLSPSEKDVALLLLKGLSLKEIAQLRNTAEKTVRSQSVAIYAKSSLSGRSELAAFFLEDLLVPQNKI
jgi:DNA-binding NarL/FixJ family response regulator